MVGGRRSAVGGRRSAVRRSAVPRLSTREHERVIEERSVSSLLAHLQLGDGITHGLYFGYGAAADQVRDLDVWIDPGGQAQGDDRFFQRRGGLLSNFGECVTALDLAGPRDLARRQRRGTCAVAPVLSPEPSPAGTCSCVAAGSSWRHVHLLGSASVAVSAG